MTARSERSQAPPDQADAGEARTVGRRSAAAHDGPGQQALADAGIDPRKIDEAARRRVDAAAKVQQLRGVFSAKEPHKGVNPTKSSRLNWACRAASSRATLKDMLLDVTRCRSALKRWVV